MKIRRTLCSLCMRSLYGPERCKCLNPKPRQFEVRPLEPMTSMLVPIPQAKQAASK